jgi:hypothetical protein
VDCPTFRLKLSGSFCTQFTDEHIFQNSLSHLEVPQKGDMRQFLDSGPADITCRRREFSCHVDPTSGVFHPWRNLWIRMFIPVRTVHLPTLMAKNYWAVNFLLWLLVERLFMLCLAVWGRGLVGTFFFLSFWCDNNFLILFCSRISLDVLHLIDWDGRKR